MSEVLEQKSNELSQLLEICATEADNFIKAVGAQIDRVEQHFTAFQSETETLSDAGLAIADRAEAQADSAVDQGTAFLNDTHERIVAAIPDLSDMLDGEGDLRAAFRNLDGAITGFRYAIEDGREELMNSFDDCANTLETVEDLVSDCLSNNTLALLVSVLGQTLERLEQTLVDAADDVVTSLKEVLTDELTNLEGVAEGIMDDAMEKLDELKRTLLGKVETSGKEVIENELSTLAQEILQETLSSVLSDLNVTQISAQITTALSAQLPQLAAAKHSVGSVKRLLDIMRSGGL